MIELLLILVICGVILYLVENELPISAPFKIAIRVIVVIFLIVFLMRAFGIGDVPVPHLR
jgi:hypothetical protein